MAFIVLIIEGQVSPDDCLFLSKITQFLYEDFISLKETFKHVYFEEFNYDPYKTNVYKAEWVEPYHDMLIPINQLFASALSEYRETDEQIEISDLESITMAKLVTINDIISSMKLLVFDKEDEVNTHRITDLKHRVRIRFEQINGMNIFLKSKEKEINSLRD